MVNFERKTTPGSNQSSATVCSGATGPADSGEPRTSCIEESERLKTNKIRPKKKHLLGTLNVNTLMKIGKLKNVTDTLNKRNILILALQETRFTDENAMESNGYRIYKGKPAIKNTKNISMFGTAFMVKQNLTESITNFTSPSERISFLSFRSGNKGYTIINGHAPINQHNRTNKEKVEEFWEMLENETSKIPEHHIKILVGDFNAQIGKERKFKSVVGNYPAHKRTNKNGERLIDFCKQFNLKLMTTYFRKLARKKKTWASPNIRQGEYQLDHVAITTKSFKEIMDVRVRRGLNIDSDHYLTEIKTKFQPNKPKQKQKRVARTDTKFILQNQDKFRKIIESGKMGNWEEMKETMVGAVKEIGHPPRRPKHRWWNELCDEAIDNRLSAWQKWNNTKKKKDWETFTEVRKITSKTIRSVKRNYDRSRLEEIDMDFKKNNTREFYKTFKEVLSGYQPQSLHFKDKNGIMVLSNRENCELLAEYFENLLNCEEPIERLQFQKPQEENRPSDPPNIQEIDNIIKSLKNNKTPGEDGIVAEMWKIGGEFAKEKVHRCLKDIWTKGEIPNDWKQALIHPLHKKGDKTDTNNYRGISLLPVTYKILSKALLKRVEEQAGDSIGDYQAGFRKGRSCIEQIFNLKTILRVRTLQNKNTVVTFVDFKKAYDSLDRQTLFLTLKERGIDKNTRKLVEETLMNTTSKVKFLGEVSESFKIKTGVRQGDGLSPILFNLVLDKIIKAWEKALEEKKVKGIYMGQGKHRFEVKCLAFADDIALITDNRSDAKLMLETLHEIAEKTGLKISYEKTEYIEYRHNKEKYMTIAHGRIKRVDKFKYLGEWIQANGLDNTTSKERVRKIEMAYKLTQSLYNKKSISIQAKIRHYNSVLKPEATYGSECLTMNKKGELRDLEKRERKILRKILGPVKNAENTWIKRKNEDLFTKTEKITHTMRKRRLKLYGHLKRMDESRVTKKIFNYISKLKRTTGWMEETRKDAMKVGITEKNISDRDQYRQLIDNATFLEDQPKPRPKRVWTEDQRRAVGEKMKRYWEGRRKLNLKS